MSLAQLTRFADQLDRLSDWNGDDAVMGISAYLLHEAWALLELAEMTDLTFAEVEYLFDLDRCETPQRTAHAVRLMRDGDGDPWGTLGECAG